MASTTITTATEDWQIRCARKQEQCRNAIPRDWLIPRSLLDSLQYLLESNPNRLLDMQLVKKSGILSDREFDITENYTVQQLLSALASGDMSAVEVTTAFCKRAAIAQQLTRCLTETFFDQALERAQFLDEYRASGKPLGPLHGLPISIKDSFQVKGIEATIGFVSFLDKKAKQNSALVDVLLELGAVLYVKTNIPQTLMTADSDNNIYGRTLNPHNTALTAGGSSGGEGALVAFRGSPLGIGTDIAGSIRIPALCCGTYGFKPTSGRVPYGGQASPSLPGFTSITSSAGPLANDFDALEILTKAVIGATPARWDVTVTDVPWRDITNTTKPKLTIGLLPDDPMYPLQPPVKRAISEAVGKIEAQGHRVVKLSVADCHIADSCEVAYQLFGLAPETPMGHIKAGGEPPINSVAMNLRPANFGNYKFVPDMDGLDRLQKFAALNVQRRELLDDWRTLWLKMGLDAVLSPSAQCTAVPHDTFTWPPYTCLWNLLDYPGCVIPFMKASKSMDPEPMKMGPEQGGPTYDPKAQDGAPCSIQIIAPRMRDEECLQIARVVDSCLKTTRDVQ